jgi:hypothetical protein
MHEPGPSSVGVFYIHLELRVSDSLYYIVLLTLTL